mgnify:CR=1 FL=1
MIRMATAWAKKCEFVEKEIKRSKENWTKGQVLESSSGKSIV